MFPTDEIILSRPKHGETVDVLSGEISSFLNGYHIGLSARLPFKAGCYAPRPVRFEWSAPKGAGSFSVALSVSPEFKAPFVYAADSMHADICIPFRSKKIYWKVRCFNNNVFCESETFYFLLENIPSAVYLEGVPNVRDIGGYKGLNGRTVKTGAVYRGGNPDGIGENAKRVAIDVLNIKAVLDLRRKDEGSASEEFSPFGQNVLHVNECGCMYTGLDHREYEHAGKEGVDTVEGSSALVRELTFFADKGHFPAYVHCVLGRDRTGTLIFFLLGICGVEKRDIMRDYELSFFSETGRRENTDVAKILASAEKVFSYVDLFNGSTLQEKMTDLLLKSGMKRSRIAAIQNNLLTDKY